MDQKWREAFENPPEKWKEKWSSRKTLIRFDTEKEAVDYKKKIESDDEEKLLVDLHPKDGYVVYVK